jgi:hypothetical protein
MGGYVGRCMNEKDVWMCAKERWRGEGGYLLLKLVVQNQLRVQRRGEIRLCAAQRWRHWLNVVNMNPIRAVRSR